ncbi:MAG: hypothetical protein K0R65_1184 [Crocinitomicaceae bacterium]|jgi:hypothetical protein|nr:hypothetical protein [Crocinitomicaceae bacterium]
MKLRQLFFLFCILAAASACTIQKRTVNKGYFVQWHWQKKAVNPSEKVEAEPQESYSLTAPDEEKIADEIAIVDQEKFVNQIKPAEVNAYSVDTPSLHTEKAELKPERKTSISQEENQKEGERKHTGARRNLLDDFALLYVAIAGMLLLLATIFLLIGLNVASAVNALFFVLAISCFAGAILVLAFALLLWLFSNNIRSKRKR